MIVKTMGCNELETRWKPGFRIPDPALFVKAGAKTAKGRSRSQNRRKVLALGRIKKSHRAGEGQIPQASTQKYKS